MTPNEMDALAWLARRMEWEATVEELHARRTNHETRVDSTVNVAAACETPAPRWWRRRRATSPVRGMSPTGTVATMQQ